MLIEMAIGDAYGAGFEYAKPEFVAANHKLDAYVKHPKHDIAPGCYTDDTQMTIANAETILAGGLGADLSREALAQAYVACFKRDQREGYAGGFYRFLVEVKDGAEFLERIKPASDKSGAAMRALPFGIFPDISRVKALCALQAAITHDTKDGIDAAVAAALMAHYFLYDLGPKADLGKFIESHVPGNWSETWTEPVGEKGWMSVRAAITAVVSGDGMSDILRRAVAFTGDVDTVAALALGAAAHSREVAKDLPAVLVDGLENGPFGREFLGQMDARLMAHMKHLQAALSAPPAALAEQSHSAAASDSVVGSNVVSDSSAVSNVVSGPRILMVETMDEWTGVVQPENRHFLEIPANMDVDREEVQWFALGGDQHSRFHDYLVSRGAKKVVVERWSIRYQ